MTLATQTTTARGRARLAPVTATASPSDASCRIEIVENPIHRQDPALAAEVEERLLRILGEESLGAVTVRFSVCRDENDAFQFICKVENPSRVDTDVLMPWRWWSPLMQNAEQFAKALEDGLRVRRARLSVGTPSD